MMTNESIGQKALRLKRLKAERDLLDEKINILESEIKNEMTSQGKYEFSGEGWKVTWNMIMSKRFDQVTFSADHPKLFEKYKKMSESRRFNLS